MGYRELCYGYGGYFLSLVTFERKNISQHLETNTNELTKFRSNTNEGSSISLITEVHFDKCFPQVNLENNVKTTTTKDKGTQLQSQLFKKTNVRNIVNI